MARLILYLIVLVTLGISNVNGWGSPKISCSGGGYGAPDDWAVKQLRGCLKSLGVFVPKSADRAELLVLVYRHGTASPQPQPVGASQSVAQKSMKDSAIQMMRDLNVVLGFVGTLGAVAVSVVTFLRAKVLKDNATKAAQAANVQPRVPNNITSAPSTMPPASPPVSRPRGAADILASLSQTYGVPVADCARLGEAFALKAQNGKVPGRLIFDVFREIGIDLGLVTLQRSAFSFEDILEWARANVDWQRRTVRGVPGPTQFRVGSEVEVQRSGGQWVRGRIDEVRGDGYVVLLPDLRLQKRVPFSVALDCLRLVRR